MASSVRAEMAAALRTSSFDQCEALTLLWILEADSPNDFENWLDELAKFSRTTPRKALAVAAHLAERGYIRVDGRYLEITVQ